VRALVLLGVLLIVGGLAGLTMRFVSFTQTERVAEIGPLEVIQEKERTVAIPEIAAIAALLIGLGLVIAGTRAET